MIHQKRSGSSARLKYQFVLPLLGGALCASTLAFAKDFGIDIAPRHIAGVASPKTNMLKITSGGTTLITDKLSVHEENGKVITYTGNKLTQADKDYFFYNDNLIFEIY